MKTVEREYWVNSTDPHKCGPVTVTLHEDGLTVRHTGDPGPPLLVLSASDLVDLAKVESAQSELTWLREEAKAALATIKECRDELRGMVRVVRGGVPQFEPVCECFDAEMAREICEKINLLESETAPHISVDIASIDNVAHILDPQPARIGGSEA